MAVPEGLTRVVEGHYRLSHNGNDYQVVRSECRVHTGKTKKGTLITSWAASKNGVTLASGLSTYREARSVVMNDISSPKKESQAMSKKGGGGAISSSSLSMVPSPFEVTPTFHERVT